MPRGVPASGKRQPRTVPAAFDTAEASVAAGTLDDEDRVFEPAKEEAAVPAAPADYVIETFEPVQDVVEPELTAEQLEIKRLRDELARVQGRRDEEPVSEVIADPGDGSNILIHFLEDGLSALGKVWYRGEELEFVPGSQAHKDTYNRRGESWLDLRKDEFGQVDRFGKVMFRNGPWPGKTYLDGKFETLRAEKEGQMVAPPTEEELAAAEKARKKRAAPHLPQKV